jgi:hypothetical protein
MVTKINNEMRKIQALKNIVIFPTPLSLKNVTTSSSNEKEQK